IKHRLKHFFYTSGWKKFEPVWNFMIKHEQLQQMRPVLEAVLAKVGRAKTLQAPAQSPSPTPEPGALIISDHRLKLEKVESHEITLK
ncbi:MAG TPA: hypothetical protein V6D23_07990, partial [Candidatus Obscuribacterales bacterium]